MAFKTVKKVMVNISAQDGTPLGVQEQTVETLYMITDVSINKSGKGTAYISTEINGVVSGNQSVYSIGYNHALADLFFQAEEQIMALEEFEGAIRVVIDA